MTTHVECTRCGGAHPLSQCPWPAGLLDAVQAAQVDLLVCGTAFTQILPDGVVCHVPIEVWLKGEWNLPFSGKNRAYQFCWLDVVCRNLLLETVNAIESCSNPRTRARLCQLTKENHGSTETFRRE